MHLDDYDNVAPRFGVTWSPFASGATTLRSSWGIFYDWLQNSTIEQTVRVDGFHQQELDILRPVVPDSTGVRKCYRRRIGTCSTTAFGSREARG